MAFADELDHLIRKHTRKTRLSDDYIPLLEALFDAANALAERADRCPFKEDEPEAIGKPQAA